MDTDPTSLDRLHDIVLPPATPWWPPAPGWLWLLALVAIVLIAMFVHWFIRHQQNRYRREALAELERLHRESGKLTQAALLTELSALLKRTAITAYSRERVAGLTGESWFNFLDSAAGTRFSGGLGQQLEESNYGVSAGDWDEGALHDLHMQMQSWIRHHKPAEALPLAENGAEEPSKPATGQARAA